MPEIDFLIPPEIIVGTERSRINVKISPSPTVFPDHDAYVSVRLETNDRPPRVLTDETRVFKTERAVDAAIDVAGRKAGGILDREIARKKKVLGT